MLQREPFQKVQGNEGLAILLANVVNGADVGVVQCGSSLGFASKASQSLGITGNLLGKKLKGDEAMQPGIFRLKDNAHATTAKFLDDAVVRDSLPDHYGQILRG